MNMTLEELISGLEKSAGINKQAEDEKKDPEKAEKKDEKDAKEEIGKSKDALSKAEKDIEKAEGKNGEEEEQCKEARLSGAALANEVMSKVAALKINQANKEPEMKKEATAAGKALADALLVKLAEAGDVSTENGVTPGTVPQKIIRDNAQMVAEQSATIKPLPTGNGIRNEGSINEILDAIVSDAIAQGATSHDQGVGAKARDAVEAEGVVEESATPNQVPDEEAEKAAAVLALVDGGYDFASAVDMVKAADVQLQYEEDQSIKQAALGALMDRGVDFADAVALVKQAGRMSGLMDAAKGAASTLAHDASLVGVQARSALGAKGSARMGAMKDLAKNRAVQAGAGAGGLAAGGAMMAKRNQEKQAAVNALTESGVDFDQAVALVNEKAAQIYGA